MEAGTNALVAPAPRRHTAADIAQYMWSTLRETMQCNARGHYRTNSGSNKGGNGVRVGLHLFGSCAQQVRRRWRAAGDAHWSGGACCSTWYPRPPLTCPPLSVGSTCVIKLTCGNKGRNRLLIIIFSNKYLSSPWILIWIREISSNVKYLFNVRVIKHEMKQSTFSYFEQ